MPQRSPGRKRRKGMTQAELDALPDATPRFGCREEMRDGKLIRIPVMEPGPCPGAFWREDGDPVSVVDVYGQGWMLGRGPDGVLYKRRT